MLDAILWLIPLAIGVIFGWAWGSARTAATLSHSSAPLPHSSGDWSDGYLAGYEAARAEALRVARAHDFDTIERQLGKMDAKA